jgi:4-hydroxy-2-oxoheptanedioate aldolase
MDRTRFRKSLQRGVPQVGIFIQSSDPVNVELAGVAGFDFAVVDLEHGGHYYDCVEAMCRAGSAANIDVIVRIPSITPNNVFRPLDSGATGVQAPQVNDVSTAQIVATNAKYAPEGARGAARPRASLWGNRPEYFSVANTETAVIIHCETKQCVENIDAIIAPAGIDVVFAGPQDLSHSYGVPGDANNPLVQDAIATMLRAAQKRNIAAGVFVGSAEEAKKRIEQGFTYLIFGTDQSLLCNAMKAAISGIGQKR